jgi:hypothetical protein
LKYKKRDFLIKVFLRLKKLKIDKSIKNCRNIKKWEFLNKSVFEIGKIKNQ